MGLLDFFSKKPSQPYRNESLNKLYNLLFCDDIALYKTEDHSTDYPWNILLADAPDPAQLAAVAADQKLESRQRLLAHQVLSTIGAPTDTKELLGVVVEVGLPNGLDVLAAFSDGSARYFNQAEKLLVWETSTEQSTHLVNQLFAEGQRVINIIGKWEEKRRPFPKNGFVRMSFLVSDGLYFGEGPFEVLQADPLGSPVIQAATQLMAYLTQYKTDSESVETP
ncbi:MAG: hypothetical protein ACRYFZ_13565 [Janthinobacterium lividum]